VPAGEPARLDHDRVGRGCVSSGARCDAEFFVLLADNSRPFLKPSGVRLRLGAGSSSIRNPRPIASTGSFPIEEHADGSNQVAAERAAEASVVELVNLFLCVHDEVAIDADFA